MPERTVCRMNPVIIVINGQSLMRWTDLTMGLFKELICDIFHSKYHIYYEDARICTKCDRMRGRGVKVFRLQGVRY